MIYVILNTWVAHNMLDYLFGINHIGWNVGGGQVLDVGDGVLNVIEDSGGVNINVDVFDEFNYKYPLEVAAKDGLESIVRIKKWAGASNQDDNRLGVIFGNQDLGDYDLTGGEIMSNVKGEMKIHTKTSFEVNAVKGHVSFQDERDDGFLGIGTKTPERKLDVNGDAIVRGGLEIASANLTINNETLQVADGVMSVPVNVELVNGAQLAKGHIGAGFGDIVVPNSNVTALQVEVMKAKINDLLRVKHVVVEKTLDLTSATFIVNNTKNETGVTR